MNELTRRDFLKFGTLIAGSFLLDACVPNMQPSEGQREVTKSYEVHDTRLGAENVQFARDGRMFVREADNQYRAFFTRMVHGSVGTDQNNPVGWENAKAMGANTVTMCFVDRDVVMQGIRDAGLKVVVQFEYLFPNMQYDKQTLVNFMEKYGDMVVGFSLDEPLTDRPQPGWDPANVKSLISQFTTDCALPINIFTIGVTGSDSHARAQRRYLLDIIALAERNDSKCVLLPDNYVDVPEKTRVTDDVLNIGIPGVTDPLEGIIIPAFSDKPDIPGDQIQILRQTFAYALANDHIFSLDFYDTPWDVSEYNFTGARVNGVTNAYGSTREVLTGLLTAIAKYEDINMAPMDISQGGLKGCRRGDIISLFNESDQSRRGSVQLDPAKTYTDLLTGTTYHDVAELELTPYTGVVLLPG